METNQQWVVRGKSVRGAKHKRIGLPNQDQVDWARNAGNLVVALSDGHGSRKHFRSHLGAQFAVEAAVETILQEADVDNLTSDMLPEVRERVANKLPKRIVVAWRRRVKAHYAEQPFTEQELKKIAAAKGDQVKEEVVNTPRKAYGATLLAVLITEQFILYLQLGDGDILLVSGEQVDRLFSDQEEKLGTATNSLCMAEPEAYFNLALQPLADNKPELIMAATDGYINSFPYDKDFFQVGRDFLSLAATEGLAYIEEKLENWLLETSREGSGDDITVGLIFRNVI